MANHRTLLDVHHFTGRTGGLIYRLVLGVFIASAAFPALAAEKYGNSLDWVPADASVYSASLRLREQFDIVANSNAWRTFTEMPSVAMAWSMAEMQINNPEGPAAAFWQLMELPENQQLVKVLREMVSEEVVFYAGDKMDKLLELLAIVQGSRMAPMLAAIEDDGEGVDQNEARARMVVAAINEDPALLSIPQLTFAFKVEDAKAAETQIQRLEVFANLALQQSPLEVQFQRQTIDENDFIVLKLEGSLIPLPEEAPGDFPGDEDDYKKLKEIIKEKELTVAIGAWNGYVLLSIAENLEHLSALGEGDLLADAEEFELLKKHFDGKVVGVNYVSREVAASQHATAEDLEGMFAMLGEAITESDEAPQALKDRAAQDFEELGRDLAKYVAEPGAMAGCTLLTASGYESFTYNWGEQPTLDSSKPLDIVNHLGGSPILAVAGRGVEDPEAYDLLVKWIRKGFSYFEDFALEEMEDDEREQAEKVLEIAKPLLSRANKTTRDVLAPSMKDGQSAIVVDADITSDQWHKEMPKSATPLPMAEIAIVVGVSDVKLFRQAMREYKEILDDLVDEIRDENPEAIPADYEIPTPEEKSVTGGAVYSWDFSQHTGVDPQISLCGAIGEKYAAFATSPKLAERVLDEVKVDDAGSIVSSDATRAVVGGMDFAALVRAIRPWVEYGIRSDFAEQDPDDDPAEVKNILSQVSAGLDILQCFRSVWSETSKQGDVWVTHSVATFEDLED